MKNDNESWMVMFDIKKMLFLYKQVKPHVSLIKY